MLIIHALLFALGIALILIASHYFIKYACIIGKMLAWPDVLTGIIILGIGTSIPEIMISLYSHLADHEALLLGNILGSNIANSVLILGIAFLLSHTETLYFNDYKKPYCLMVIISLLLVVSIYSQSISYISGGMLFLLSMANFIQKRRLPEETKNKNPNKTLQLFREGILTAFFLALIFIAAKITVTSGLAIANILDLKESTFGALFIAISTSLPEIAVAGIAASQKKLCLVFSTIIGSNIANIGFAIGLCAIFKPIYIPANGIFAMSIIALVTSSLIAPLLKMTTGFNKIKGMLLLIAYGAFTAWLIGL